MSGLRWIVLNGMFALFFLGHAYGHKAEAAIKGITLGELHKQIQIAKEVQSIFAGHTKLELAEFVGKYIAETRPPKGIDEELHGLHQDVASVYVASFTLSHDLSDEEVVELTVMFNAMPLYAKIPHKGLNKKTVDSDRDLADDMYFYGAHEDFAADHKHYLSDETVNELVNQPHKLRKHWYRAREVLKVALFSTDD